MSRRVALVLSGGGAKAAYEAGALLPIVRKAGRVDIVSGVSTGAINAAVLACTFEQTGNWAKSALAVRRVWAEIGPLFRFELGSVFRKMIGSIVTSDGPFSLKSFFNFPSLVDVAAVRQKVDEIIPDWRFTDLSRIDLAVAATDLTRGRSVSFDKGNDAPIRQAVLASSCFPVLFPPVEIAGRLHIDGGIFNNTPVKTALLSKATDVFVVGVKPVDSGVQLDSVDADVTYATLFDVGVRLLELILDRLMFEDLANARKHNELIAVIREMESRGEDGLVDRLKAAIEYDEYGDSLHPVNFYDVAPAEPLDPPGTLGFDDEDALQRLIDMGEQDATEQLRHVHIPSE